MTKRWNSHKEIACKKAINGYFAFKSSPFRRGVNLAKCQNLKLKVEILIMLQFIQRLRDKPVWTYFFIFPRPHRITWPDKSRHYSFVWMQKNGRTSWSSHQKLFSIKRTNRFRQSQRSQKWFPKTTCLKISHELA